MGDSSSFIKIGPAGSGVITEEEKSAVYDRLDECIFGDEFFVFDEREAWDEKGRGKISQIFIWHNKNWINSIQFQYYDEKVKGSPDSFFLSDRHGTANGTKFDVVKLDLKSNEHITWIVCHTNSDNILCSVTFGTNCGQYGPFGGCSGKGVQEYNFRLGDGNEFAGFYGAFNKTNLTSIGFYLKP